jgi:hypothetical protein
MLAGRVIEEVDLSAAEPVHPYARILFDPWSGPLPRGRLADSGCPYRLDCPLLDDAVAARCASTVPGLHPLEAHNHRVACHALAAPGALSGTL